MTKESVEEKAESSSLQASQGTCLSDLAAGLRIPHPPVAGRVDGEILDLRSQVDPDAAVTFVTREDPDALEVLRHSAAHLLAHAVTDLFPDSEVGIGPAVETGFYYDFHREIPFSIEDLEAIERRMKDIAAEDQPIERVVLPRDEAVRMFREKGQNLKAQLVLEKGGEEVSCYRQGPFIDFCLGPHVMSTGPLVHVKLLSVSGAYWKGDEKGLQLQRIYGTAFFTAPDLEAHLKFLEEAKKRDHRRLGQDLELFSLNEDLGSGLILWHPQGARIREVIEQYWRKRHRDGGYDLLYSPHIGRENLWKTSGHLDFYKDAMYAPMDIDGQNYYIKPMNCPLHVLIYKSRLHSYRDLPLRWAELGTVYRYERSGTLHGLLRVRGFTQDDAHIICTPDQIEDEILRVLDFSISILAAFGFTDNAIELSVRDPRDAAKYCGPDDMWCRAEASLLKALETRGLKFKRMEGEAVFYGPKIDIKVKDAIGRLWQCTTIQFDFNNPDRFDMSYVGEDGRTHRPYMVHRALLGSLERFFGILIEHYNGAFPVWLAPVQAIVLPIAERHEDYARQLDEKLRAAGLRSRVDLSREKTGKKIREAEVKKIPLILVVGDREAESGTASLRIRSRGDIGDVAIEDFISETLELDRTQALHIDIFRK